MGITMTVMGRLGTPERPSFFPEGRTYSPPALRAGGVSLPLVGSCALRGGLRSLRRAPANAAETAVPVIIACAEGAVHLSLRLQKPATGSFIAEAGRSKNVRPAFSFAKEKQKK